MGKGIEAQLMTFLMDTYVRVGELEQRLEDVEQRLNVMSDCECCAEACDMDALLDTLGFTDAGCDCECE